MYYFAWLGGDPIPPFSLRTTGDVWGGTWKTLGDTWGGSLSTTADLLPTGVWSTRQKQITNLRSNAGLQSGRTYFIRGAGIPSMFGMEQVGPGPLQTGQFGYTTGFTFDGDHGGEMSLGGEPFEASSVVIFSSVDTTTGISQYSDQVYLHDTTNLVVGLTYKIGGGSIPENTFFTFEGDNNITITQPALTTALNVNMTITLETGANVIKNLGSTAGLVVGTTYSVFGKGIGESTLGTFQSDGTLLLLQDATISTKQALLQIFLGTQYPDGGDFQPEYARNDETVIDLRIEHAEGNFALLTIGLKNPRVGFLSPGRNVWCWLSRQATPDDPVEPLFHGRLVASPANIEGEKVSLQFIAEPNDYRNQQILLIPSLYQDPYVDPIWLQNGTVTPENILEARTAAWHIDRTSLVVSTSDITTGEDGTLELTEGQHLYSDMEQTYESSPLSAVYGQATVSWPQEWTGTVDITSSIKNAFHEAGSPSGVSSYSGDGLFDSWPKPETSIGGGWVVGKDSYIQNISSRLGIPGLTTQFPSSYYSSVLPSDAILNNALTPTFPQVTEFGVTFPLYVFDVKFTVDGIATRNWTESVSFLLQADMQQIRTDARSSIETFNLSSNLLLWPIDPGGAVPLRDTRDNSYFKSDRGQQSFRYLLAFAKAKLVKRARAVRIVFTTTFDLAKDLSCRGNITLFDGRLPGGQATGKVIKYELIAGGREGERARVTIGCTIGNGGSQTTTPGVGTYAADGYMAPGYQAVSGGTVDIGDGSITYENFDDFTIEDDGVNFFNLQPDNIIVRLVVAGGVTDQVLAIAATRSALLPGGVPQPPIPDPVGALKQVYTTVTLQMVPIDSATFQTQLAVQVSNLSISKTIDLSA